MWNVLGGAVAGVPVEVVAAVRVEIHRRQYCLSLSDAVRTHTVPLKCAHRFDDETNSINRRYSD